MYVTSDVRIKENIKRLSGDKAIEQIHKIPARSYNYIDKTSKGSGEKLGFVAQEVANVLPGTITTQKNFLPSVMKTLNGTWNGLKYSDDSLQNVNGETYRFYVSNDEGNDEHVFDVIGNNDNSFTFDEKYEHIFCYGKEVDDFHVLDKDQIFTLHHSAIQELDNKISNLNNGRDIGHEKNKSATIDDIQKQLMNFNQK